MGATKLSAQEVSAELTKLPGWSVEDGKLRRVFEFHLRDFHGGNFSFMSQVALAAEKMDHHPDWVELLEQGGLSR